mgnify:CR=1 FL=1
MDGWDMVRWDDTKNKTKSKSIGYAVCWLVGWDINNNNKAWKQQQQTITQANE